MSGELTERELDAAVSQRVFGKHTRLVRYVEGYSWPNGKGKFLQDEFKETHFAEALVEEMEDKEILYVDYDGEPRIVAKSVPNYSLKIDAAWCIVAHLRPDWRFLFQEAPTEKWRAAFISKHFHDVTFMADDDSAETAICRAALLAVDWRSSTTQMPEVSV